jgi:transposase-like protein
MPKKTSRKRISATERNRILAEARSKGWTAARIAKEAGVSKWTVYGWRKRKGPQRTTGRPKTAKRAATGAPSIRTDFRAVVSEIVREELAGLLASLTTTRARGSRA